MDGSTITISLVKLTTFSGVSRISCDWGLHSGGFRGRGGPEALPQKIFKNRLCLEAFTTTLELINQSCYILNKKGKFKF